MLVKTSQLRYFNAQPKVSPFYLPFSVTTSTIRTTIVRLNPPSPQLVTGKENKRKKKNKIRIASFGIFLHPLFKILYKKIMNALTRKARSRSKRHLNTAPPPILCAREEDDSSPPAQPFINHGLQKWTQDRLAWTSYKSPASTPKRIHAPTHRSSQLLNYDRELLFHALIAPDNQGMLPKRVPLGELIAVLQDVRERGE